MHIYRFSFFLIVFILLTGCDFIKKEREGTAKKTSCEPNKVCRYPNDVKVWLSSEVLSPETPFTIFSELPTGYTIKNARLEGESMYMGFIPQQFSKKGLLWESDTQVGVCSEQNMLWKLTLNIINASTSEEKKLYYFFYVTY